LLFTRGRLGVDRRLPAPALLLLLPDRLFERGADGARGCAAGAAALGADVLGADVLGADVLGADVLGADVLGAEVVLRAGALARGGADTRLFPERVAVDERFVGALARVGVAARVVVLRRDVVC